MKTLRPCSAAIATILFLAPGTSARAETPLTTELVASGFSLPLYVTAPPGDTQRLFVVEQRSGTSARVKIVDLATGAVNATPFLTITGVSTGNEQGLLGLAFHPDYASNGHFYVNFTNSAGTTIVRRYTVSPDPDTADPNSAYAILSVSQPFSNHNGGWIAFGPDGYLYVALGDGGDANDPGNRAQTITNQLLGKLLRLDADGDDFPADANRNYAIPPNNPFVGIAGDDEIWAYGLRNPWRCSFDRLTGDLYIADVGQAQWEEIDFQPAASPGGENYGWRCMEGNHCTGLTGCTCNSPNLVNPIHEFSHTLGCSISGGYVYRGTQICDLQGTYFFADYCTDRVWSFRYDGANLTDFRERTAELTPAGGPALNAITSFGEDAAGELYIISRDGNVLRIVPDGPRKGDLNVDGVIGFGDINPFVLALTDPGTYTATYGYPPQQAGDLNCSGTLDFGDINPFVLLLTQSSRYAAPATPREEGTAQAQRRSF